MDAEFRAPRGLRSGHLQSILASSALRRALTRHQAAPFLAASERRILKTPAGVRLEAWITRAEGDRGVALLFHGWEGQAAASYVVETGLRLHRAGFHVVRLNFRDHGDTHGLNEDLFHSCRLAEVVDATALVSAQFPGVPLFLAGFSLGGNFALRVAREGHSPITRTIAVSPVINPAEALAAIEAAPAIYQLYFMRKWRRSLRRKHALFPERFADAARVRLGLRDTTAWLVEHYTDYPSLEAYLDGYTIGGDRLQSLAVHSTIITADDDPVIPVSAFRSLRLPANVSCQILRGGGHCGFIDNWRLESWAARFITNEFLDATGLTGKASEEQWEPLSC